MKMSMTKPLLNWNGTPVIRTDNYGNAITTPEAPDGVLFTLRDTITQCIDRIPPQAGAEEKGKAGALAARLWAGDVLDFDEATAAQITELVTAYAPVLGHARVTAELTAAATDEALLPQAG